MCAFRDRKQQWQTLNAVVYGISPDDIASHQKFRDKYDLNFRLLVDTDHKVAAKYGAWREKTVAGKKLKGIQRSTYLIDAQGKVARVWQQVQVDGHDDQVLEALQEVVNQV